MSTCGRSSCPWLAKPSVNMRMQKGQALLTASGLVSRSCRVRSIFTRSFQGSSSLNI
jgi:hypothetical protein